MENVETVTVLITDLVGSTGLAARVGPAVAEALRTETFGLIRAALEQTGGREGKNTGDGLMLAFASAAAAVSCAVSVQQQFERRNRGAREQLLIKVGLSCGDVTGAEGDYFGMPVVEAARLCERCTGGQILATDPDVRNAHRRPAGKNYVGQPTILQEDGRQGFRRCVLFQRQSERLRGCAVVRG